MSQPSDPSPPADAPPSSPRTRVVAAVVTYNRKQLLVECLEALLVQSRPLERIFVVDNASTDGTREMLAERGLLDHPKVDYERLEENTGSSGGFARAIDRARRGGCDWLWVMDDDAEPVPDALERLLVSPPAYDPGTAALCQAVHSPDGSLQLGARGHFKRRPVALAADAYAGHPELGYSTFVGILVRGEVARATDPPRAEFFIWADDYEWCLRLRRHGKLVLVPESRILHKDVGHGYTNRRSQFFNRLFGWSYGPTPYEGFWRNICGVRNYVWIKRTYQRQSPFGAAATVGQFVVKALLYDERPLRRVPWIVRAGVDGRRGIFRNITPQEWRERLSRR